MPKAGIQVVSLASCICTVASNYGRGARARARRLHHLDRSNRSREGGSSWEMLEDHQQSKRSSTSRGRRREVLEMLQQEEESVSGGGALECCPSVVEMVEPLSGRNRDGLLLELFRDSAVQQRFYEVSCRSGVAEQPCRFLERRLSRFSRCVQQYSYTYALVRDPFSSSTSSSPWRLDYIQVRSGCSCQLEPTKKKRKRPNRNSDHA